MIGNADWVGDCMTSGTDLQSISSCSFSKGLSRIGFCGLMHDPEHRPPLSHVDHVGAEQGMQLTHIQCKACSEIRTLRTVLGPLNAGEDCN